ncbi:cell wall metabolism sensor histidine kinase WalK [Bacillus sp. FJAT-26390]|uniref:sensor histidine kinase n=1 Tax=Bacillus sp. FJAT-26390 TaxID=1743142 RepID=UPI0008080F4E|nr:HAMP domain-containing sensor histidine kinase [Bacillus sp. FJAT-26390]OBZ11316.1 two-component sensor histidine kinase [Bacillus sp. FJAT-26390]
MKSLYVRIVFTFVMVAMISGILGLMLTGLYYQNNQQSSNEQKMIDIAQNIKVQYEQNPQMDLNAYLTHIAALGFQIYLARADNQGQAYGSPFKHGKLTEQQIQAVIGGAIYRGMEERKDRLQLFSYFKNSLLNTAGLPIETKEGMAALFIRPDLQQQIGEIRIIAAILIGLTFMISLVLIVILSRLIVRPVNDLTKATKQIVAGDFDAGLQLSRKDEIGELARNFSVMTREIKQLDQMRQEFVSNVSHEFQTPLTSIQGLARAVLDKETTAEQTESYLTIIEKESKRLSAMSKQLLTLAALDKENKPLNKTTFRLDEQIRHILITLEWQWMEKELQWELDLPDTTIHADHQLLHEVWLNLIVNSIKFSKPGQSIGITLTDSDAITVEIRDSGIGIAEEDLPHIFDRFYKADKARGRSSAGSGLGLSIVHKLVALHQGAIHVQSQPAAGTTVTVTLPRL